MNWRHVGIWELVRCSTVRIETAGQEHRGTGFFAAPGFVVTAAHVVVQAKGDPKAVAVVWAGGRHVPTEVCFLADPPPGGLGGDKPYPWPDIAILKLAFTEHPCVPLSTGWPSDNPSPNLYSWAYANEYQRYSVGGISVGLAYNGPIDDTASPVGDDGQPRRLLKLKWEQVIGGMSGAPLLDESTWRVCAVMKRTRNDGAQEGGYATAVADMWKSAEPLVAELKVEQAKYLERLGVDDTFEAKVRWGTLPDVVARKLDANLAAALVRALNQEGYELDLTLVPEPQRAAYVARLLFSTDIRTLALVLSNVEEDDEIELEVAQLIFRTVSCCLPVTVDRSDLPTQRPIAWWIPPEAADQLRRVVEASGPVVARVAASERPTIDMLVRRAAADSELRLADSDNLNVPTPDGSTWLDDVDTVIRGAAKGARPGWSEDPDIRKFVIGWLRDKHVLIPLPGTGPLTPGDLVALFDRFGDLPFVLGRRDGIPAVDSDPRVVTIQPEVDATLEKQAVLYYGNILGWAS